MYSFRPLYLLLFIVALVSGCASADKRFDQGFKLETQGQYEQATMRYAQALEKDPSLEAARIRLREVGDLAIAERLEDADDLAFRGDPVSSSSHFRRADVVVARARGVGVHLTLPVDYAERRRSVFDDAFEALVYRGVMARERGQWQEGLDACRRARNEFEPSLEQRDRALVEESTLFVQWSEDEYERGHLRTAFGVAANVQAMEWSPVNQSARAAAIMANSIAEGEVELIVLPVQPPSGKRSKTGWNRELAAQVETTLWQGPWRTPPPFVLLQETLAVRALMTHSKILDGEYRAATMALILRLAEADYAAHLQLLGSEFTEFDVRSRTQIVQTRSKKSTTFVREDGKLRIQAKARVIVTDGFGNEIADVIVSGSGTAPFARGVYDGDPRDLNLDSRQVDLFDHFALEEQEHAAREALVRDLSANIAGAVFQPTLAQVP